MRDYRAYHGRWPNLCWPRRYSEKVQWRKLFDRDPRHTVLCDKLAARAFILSRWPEAPLAPLLWQGEPPVPFNKLEPPYVLKSSHGCGHVLFVDGPVDQPAVERQTRAWLDHCHGTASDEPAYVAVPRRLLAERRLIGADGRAPRERRIFTFAGRPAVINTVFIEDGRIRNGAFHLPDWTRLDWFLSRDLAAAAFPSPPRLDDMLAAAARIGAGLEHVRVDFYDTDERFWIGEVTVYPWSGHAVFNPDQADFQLGRYWRQRRRLARAALVLAGG